MREQGILILTRGSFERRRDETLRKWFRSNEENWSDFEAEAVPLLPDVYRVALWLTRNKDEAEDLVQDTMFQAMRSFHRYETGTNCRAWLMKIMYHLNLKRLRSLRKLKLVDTLDDDLEQTLMFEPSVPERLEDREIIDTLMALPEKFLDVVVLSDIEEFSYKEISRILSIPIGTVMSRLSRGRKLLRQELAQVARGYGFAARRKEAAG